MKKILIALGAILTSMTATAASSIVATVTVTYDGTSATVDIPSSVSSYVKCSSGTSSHVKIVQSSTTTNTPGEIMYVLSGTSADGEFHMTGEYKTTIQLNGLTLTNPDSTAIHIKDGKRIKVSIAKGTVNTLTDGKTDLESKGCFHSKGHTEFAGNGTLNIVGNIRHGIYSKEYVQIKNCTINITSAVKDGIHCQQYFLMESGAVTINSAGDDGIQVELKGETPMAATADEDEDTGNFYMKGGTLTINATTGYAVKADGTITYTGGLQEFNTANTLENARLGIANPFTDTVGTNGQPVVYDLHGRQLPTGSQPARGIYILREKGKAKKVLR